jgi:CheY-like chemotaxis protein
MGSHGPASILCIERRSEICLLLGMMLSGTSRTLHRVGSMSEAIAILKAQQPEQPELIIIDNFFAIDEIGAHVIALRSAAPSSKILMISALAEETENLAHLTGVNRCLTKPFTKETLVATVSSMFS